MVFEGFFVLYVADDWTAEYAVIIVLLDAPVSNLILSTVVIYSVQLCVTKFHLDMIGCLFRAVRGIVHIQCLHWIEPTCMLAAAKSSYWLLCCYVVHSGVAGACRRRDGRCRSRRRYQRRTTAGVVVFLVGGGFDGAGGDREGSADTAAAGAGTARSQVSAAGTAAAAATQQRRRRSIHGATAGALHAAQLCQHEERAQAHDQLQRGHEMHG